MKSVMRVCATFVLAAASLALCAQGAAGSGSSEDANNRGVSDPMATTSMTLLRCASADGGLCTLDQVAELNRGIVSNRRQRKLLATVQYLDLEPNGWLKCSQTDGSQCTDEQVSAVIAVAAGVQSHGEGLRLSRSMDVATR